MATVNRGRGCLDTNVLVYANDPRDRTKHERANQLIHDLLRSRTGVVPAQVLHEFSAVALQKLRLAPEVVDEQLRLFGALRVVPLDAALVRAAIELHRRNQINYWDAAILAAAERAGCDILYTEDLNHGQVYGTVRVNNPFA